MTRRRARGTEKGGSIYDAEGNRVAKLGAGGTLETVYVLTSGNAQLDELTGSGGWNHTNIYAPGGRLLATYDSSTQPSPGYHDNLTDWLGTKRMQTTAGGNQQETCTSNPYGDGLSCTGGADATEQHFTGKDHDTESNLDYFYARYYSEILGRFMTPDWSNDPEPVPNADPTDPQSFNLYAYVENDPIDFIDVDGHYSSDDPMADWEEGMDQAEAGQENMQGAADTAGAEGADPDSGYTTDSDAPTAPGDKEKPIKVPPQTVVVIGYLPPPPPLMPLYVPGEGLPSLPYPSPYGAGAIYYGNKGERNWAASPSGTPNEEKVNKKARYDPKTKKWWIKDKNGNRKNLGPGFTPSPEQLKKAGLAMTGAAAAGAAGWSVMQILEGLGPAGALFF